MTGFQVKTVYLDGCDPNIFPSRMFENTVGRELSDARDIGYAVFMVLEVIADALTGKSEQYDEGKAVIVAGCGEVFAVARRYVDDVSPVEQIYAILVDYGGRIRAKEVSPY